MVLLVYVGSQKVHDFTKFVVKSSFSFSSKLNFAQGTLLFKSQDVLIDAFFAEKMETMLDNERFIHRILANGTGELLNDRFDAQGRELLGSEFGEHFGVDVTNLGVNDSFDFLLNVFVFFFVVF